MKIAVGSGDWWKPEGGRFHELSHQGHGCGFLCVRAGFRSASPDTVSDAAIEQARRYARIQYLRGRIDGLETDAQEQDNTADDLEQRGKSGAIAKIIGAAGTVGAVKFRLQPEEDSNEAQSMRDELARLESQDKLNAGVPAP